MFSDIFAIVVLRNKIWDPVCLRPRQTWIKIHSILRWDWELENLPILKTQILQYYLKVKHMTLIVYCKSIKFHKPVPFKYINFTFYTDHFTNIFLIVHFYIRIYTGAVNQVFCGPSRSMWGEPMVYIFYIFFLCAPCIVGFILVLVLPCFLICSDLVLFSSDALDSCAHNWSCR